jgi:hypothetical protein
VKKELEELDKAELVDIIISLRMNLTKRTNEVAQERGKMKSVRVRLMKMKRMIDYILDHPYTIGSGD